MSIRFLLLPLLIIPVISFAQESCGNIVTNFDEIETTQIVDCDDPFQTINGPAIDVVAQTANGQELTDDIALQLSSGSQTIEFATSITFSNQSEDVFVYTYLFEKQGQDYVMAGDSRSGQLVVSDVQAGDYVLVSDIEGVPILSQETNWLQKLQSWVIPQAFAQFAPFSLERVATPFVVTMDEMLPECGSLITVDENGDQISNQVITDCDNPFDEFDGDIVSNPVLDLMQEPFIDLEDGVIVEVESLPSDISFSARFSLSAGTPTLDRSAALYQHATSGDYISYPADPDNLLYFAPEQGTYTLVSSWFIDNDSGEQELTERVAVTFEIEEIKPGPDGASSVLFLPGIQASRLYEINSSDVEVRLWETVSNDSIARLEMTESGDSVNDIYTSDAIPAAFGAVDIYRDFFVNLFTLRNNEVIKEYEVFAYDWRRSVFNSATQPVAYPDGEEKRLLEEVLQLAEESYTGKVTIIGHSNGGLVAKALLEEYGSTNLLEKVDKLIMIGTPQLGTPKTINAMMHGSILDGFADTLVFDNELIRDTVRNMPGTYTLLPSSRYFDEVAPTPLITNDGSALAAQVADYESVTSQLALQDFLTDSAGIFPSNPSIYEPEALNAALLAQAIAEQTLLDAWQAPEGVEVYEVVGTGLPTIVGIEYREYACSIFGIFSCDDSVQLQPRLMFSNQGDRTVIAGSAAGYDGDKTVAYVDLELEGNQRFAKERSHSNLTESPTVQEFVNNVVRYPYLADALTVPEFTEVSNQYTIISTHSPVTPRLVMADGRVVGMQEGEVFEEVIGSQFIRLGEVTYLILPSDIGDYRIEIDGDGDGIFTLQVEELGENDAQVLAVEIVASTTDSMQAVMRVSEDGYSNLLSDLDGNGEFDQEWTPAGDLVPDDTSPTSYTYGDLRAAVNQIDNRFLKRYLNRKVDYLEWLKKKSDVYPRFEQLESRALRRLDRTIGRFKRRGLLTAAQVEGLAVIINYLKNN